jgi:hypothetical protein
VSWTDAPADVIEVALKYCRGKYQRNVVLGFEALSGSTLKGKARNYSGRYSASVSSLLERLRANGISVKERRAQPGNKRILVLRFPSLLTLFDYYE